MRIDTQTHRQTRSSKYSDLLPGGRSNNTNQRILLPAYMGDILAYRKPNSKLPHVTAVYNRTEGTN